MNGARPFGAARGAGRPGRAAARRPLRLPRRGRAGPTAPRAASRETASRETARRTPEKTCRVPLGSGGGRSRPDAARRSPRPRGGRSVFMPSRTAPGGRSSVRTSGRARRSAGAATRSRRGPGPTRGGTARAGPRGRDRESVRGGPCCASPACGPPRARRRARIRPRRRRSESAEVARGLCDEVDPGAQVVRTVRDDPDAHAASAFHERRSRTVPAGGGRGGRRPGRSLLTRRPAAAGRAWSSAGSPPRRGSAPGTGGRAGSGRCGVAANFSAPYVRAPRPGLLAEIRVDGGGNPSTSWGRRASSPGRPSAEPYGLIASLPPYRAKRW